MKINPIFFEARLKKECCTCNVKKMVDDKEVCLGCIFLIDYRSGKAMFPAHQYNLPSIYILDKTSIYYNLYNPKLQWKPLPKDKEIKHINGDIWDDSKDNLKLGDAIIGVKKAAEIKKKAEEAKKKKEIIAKTKPIPRRVEKVEEKQTLEGFLKGLTGKKQELKIDKKLSKILGQRISASGLRDKILSTIRNSKSLSKFAYVERRTFKTNFLIMISKDEELPKYVNNNYADVRGD